MVETSTTYYLHQQLCWEADTASRASVPPRYNLTVAAGGGAGGGVMLGWQPGSRPDSLTVRQFGQAEVRREGGLEDSGQFLLAGLRPATPYLVCLAGRAGEECTEVTTQPEAFLGTQVASAAAVSTGVSY